jgi:hypothetical protein
MFAKKLLILFIILLLPICTHAEGVLIDEGVEIDGVKYLLMYNWFRETGEISPLYAEVSGGKRYSGKIVIPNSINVLLQKVGNNKEITFEVRYIYDRAFIGCNEMTSISIPASIREINHYPHIHEPYTSYFNGCTNLEEIVVEEGNSVYDSRGNCNALLSSNRLIAGCCKTVIPDGIEIIGEASFENCTRLTQIETPNSVTDIGAYAFSECTDLQSVSFSTSLTRIGAFAFKNCTSLETISIPESVNTISAGAFEGCNMLSDVYCYTLTPPAFETYNNYYRKQDNVGNPIFDESIKNATLHVPGSAIKKYKETVPWKNFKEIVAIPGTEVIEKYKLTYMVDGEEYKVVEINEGDSITPEAVPTKEGYTFSGWDNVPETMPAYDVTVTGHFTANKYTIIYYVDGEVYKTVEVEYGSEITAEEEPTKEGYDFSGWSWIPSKMPAEDVTVTGSFTKASYEVDGVTYQLDDYGAILTSMADAAGDVVINTEVTIRGKLYKIFVIGEGAFQGNDRITSLTVPDGIEVIMPNAFDGCRNLIKMMLGKTVRQIGSKAFSGIGKAAAYTRADAESLTIECYAESVPQADYDCFDGVDVASAIVRVNDNLTKDYKTTSPWNQFGTILGFNETVAVIPIFADEEGAVIFSIDGRRIDKPQKGMNIIRSSKSAKKVFVR